MLEMVVVQMHLYAHFLFQQNKIRAKSTAENEIHLKPHHSSSSTGIGQGFKSSLLRTNKIQGRYFCTITRGSKPKCLVCLFKFASHAIYQISKVLYCIKFVNRFQMQVNAALSLFQTCYSKF